MDPVQQPQSDQQPQQPAPAQYQQVNASLVLILGILSILPMGVTQFFGPVAFFMGRSALKVIDSGRGNPLERTNALAGTICGAIGSVFLILVIIFAIVVAAFQIEMYRSFANAIGSFTDSGSSATSPAPAPVAPKPSDEHKPKSDVQHTLLPVTNPQATSLVICLAPKSFISNQS